MRIHQLEELKTAYENIKARKQLKERIDKIMKRHSVMKGIVNAAAVAIVVFGVFVGALNSVPAFAQGIANIGGMESVVSILTFGRYQINDGHFSANIVTPHIEGLLDKALQNKINNDFEESADLVIATFEKEYKEIKEQYPEAHMGVEYNYQVLTDNDDILAIDVYLFNAVGSSSTKHKFYTIRKKTGELVTLPSLFKENADYVGVLSEYILSEMKRLNAAEERMFWVEAGEYIEPFAKIKSEQNFYLNHDGDLVISFDKYEVAPGAMGSPQFVIPESIIKEIKR